MTIYEDLHLLEEDRRIGIIGESAMQGNVVGVIIERDEVKIARYLSKLATRFPLLTHERFDDPDGLVSLAIKLHTGPLS